MRTTTPSADALRRSPHIHSADGDAGYDTVHFTTASGAAYTLTLNEAEPTDDDRLPEPLLIEAVAAAILNHQHFVEATPDSPNDDALTVQTRDGLRHRLVLGVDPEQGNAGQEEQGAPPVHIPAAVDRILSSTPRVEDRAIAELLNSVAATWKFQDAQVRENASALTRVVMLRRSEG
ncbi:hypothetical protein ACOKM5_43410 [Streptomyces sp. BH097]|uniref:hypothetical protein n=1 Tax=unclassified Streptomyces TaxID=2593676 RepID=UPI003BB6DCC6